MMDINEPKVAEKRRRFYMLLQNGWRHMTFKEKEAVGVDIAHMYQGLCPVGWDVMSQDAHFSLKESESEEIARDKVRVGSSGGVWIDCV